ncbi:glycosyltransferase family 39 protein, partial [bacterium]|nr:glycosyltransferase family 39 protein [bacterium]
MAASFAENFRAGLRRHCAGLAFAVVLAMAAHGAALFDFTTAIPGDGWSDAPTKIWEAWWAHRSIFEDGRLPLWTDRIRHPDAGALFMSGPLLSGLAALLTPVVGLVPAYNLSLLFWMTLGAFGTYLLAQRLTGDRVAGLVAAMGYRFSPFVLAYVLGSGTAELTGLGLLPLALFYLHRSALGGCVRDGVWAGVWMAATLVSSAYVAALTVAFCCLLIPYVLLIGRRRPAAYWLMRDTPPHAVYWKGPAAAIGTTVAFAAIPLGLLF